MIARTAGAWNRFWFAETPLARLAAWRILLVYLCFHDFWAYSYMIWRNADSPGASWRPLYIFEVLGVGPVDLATAQVLFVVFCVACVFAWIGLFTRTACFVMGLLALYWTAQVYSFGKAHHDKVAFAFALMALPLAPCGARFSVDAWLRTRRRRARGLPDYESETHPLAGFPLRVTQVSIAFGYFFSGMSKLVLIGPSWANGWTLQGIMVSFDGEYTHLLVPSVTMCLVLSVLTLVVQTAFPLVFFWKASRWFFLPIAAGFHIVAWKTMETGPYMTLWLLLLCFLPLEKLPHIVATELRSGLWRALRISAITLPFVVIFFVVWFGPMIPLWLSIFFVPPVAAFARLALRGVVAR